MSTTAPLTERTTKAVLLALWRNGSTREMPVQSLLKTTLAPLPDVQEALVVLRQRRCLIEQTPAGLRLVSTGLACWQDVLEEVSREKGLRVGRRVKVFSRTGSTNDVAWQFAGSGEGDGLIVVADEQTAGRGRHGNTWSAKAEQSILMSVLLKDTAAEDADRMTLLAGLAAAEAVEQAVNGATGRELCVQIKWPNDLLVNGKKLAGILVERRGDFAVVGVGINVAQGIGDFSPEVSERATSVYQAMGLQVDRLRIAAALMERLDELVAEGRRDQGVWLREWKSRCGMVGKPVTLRAGQRTIRGQVVDVDPFKGLVVRDGTGAMVFVSSQTASVIG